MYNALELFSGCGGFSNGLLKAGFNIVVANDIWPPAMQTYTHNHPQTNFVLGDITQESIKNQILNHFKDIKCDVIFGGPPCQAYSMAGNRNPNDPRGQLFKEYVSIVKELSPPIFVMENVKGILSMRHKDGAVINKIIGEFKKIGYRIDYEVLNSVDYGDPQYRERLILIGTKEGVPVIFPEQTHGDIQELLPYKTVFEAIDDIADKPEDIPWNHIFAKHSSKFIAKIKKTKVGTNLSGNYSEAFFRTPPDKPCKTVKGNHGSVFIHYRKNRSISPRELARLQSFPDDFIFMGSKHDMFVQIGNAVPNELASAIAGAVKLSLDRIRR